MSCYALELVIVLNPHPDTNKRDFDDPRYKPIVVKVAATKTSWEDSCQLAFERVEAVKAQGYPRATLQEVGCLWSERADYQEIHIKVWSLLRTKYPDVTVEVSDDCC